MLSILSSFRHSRAFLAGSEGLPSLLGPTHIRLSRPLHDKMVEFHPDPNAPPIEIKVNGKKLKVAPGSSILQACRANHQFVPTLCYHPMLSVAGSCRVCLVDSVNPESGDSKLVPACATPVTPGMDIRTNSELVRQSVKHNLKMLRCKHPDGCMNCPANGHCEFQDLVFRYEVTDVLPENKGVRSVLYDKSSHAIDRDMSKCILCSRCIRACAEVQGMNIFRMADRGEHERVSTYNDLPLSQTACISCGQCTAVCPVGALVEKPHFNQVAELLTHPGPNIMIAQCAPAVRVAISEEFGMAPGTVSTGKLVASLKRLGFDYVFDTNFAADLTILEEADEFASRLTQNRDMPMFTSCCPGWINLVEKLYPQLLPHLSTCKSPQGMLSALIKRRFAQQIGVSPKNITIVSIMPCVAKKDEIKRPQLYMDVDGSSIPETDFVLTTRELGRLIERSRIPFATLADEEFDNPLGASSGAAALFGATGGVMEAALRTAHFNLTGKDLEKIDLHAVRDLAQAGHKIREADLKIGDIDLKVAVVTGSVNIRKVIEMVLAGEKRWQLIEVMACPGGCVGGGGEPKSQLDPDTLMKRIKAIHSIDGASKVRMSHHNLQLKKLYETYLRHPNSHISHSILHTHYTDRTAEVLEDSQ